MIDFGDEWDNVYHGERAPERWKWSLDLGPFFWWLSFKHGRVGISRYLSYESAVVFHQKQLPCPSLPLSNNARQPRASSLLQLLLGAELVGVTALLLAAVGGTGRETSLMRSQIFRVPWSRAVAHRLCGEDLRSTCGRWPCRSCTWRQGP